MKLDAIAWAEANRYQASLSRGWGYSTNHRYLFVLPPRELDGRATCTPSDLIEEFDQMLYGDNNLSLLVQRDWVDV